MTAPATAATPAGAVAKIARRLVFALGVSASAGVLVALLWRSSLLALLLSIGLLAAAATAAFSLFEAWPRRLPRGFARWVLQVLAVGLAMPATTFVLHVVPSLRDTRLHDWLLVTFVGMLVAPWTALAAIVRQKEAFLRHQELAFALERSELERQALDARLHLLQAQVAPHFLFNTLANVQALVDAGSPRASTVLRSLIAYLRGAVRQLHGPTATIERELQLVRPYLELMQLRMPDRLRFAVDVDPSALELHCPPAALLTLVENAVRHGIDPSEEGGRIDVQVERRGERCLVRVTDTGVGLSPRGSDSGTGLETLRERLRLLFGDAAELRLTAGTPRGVAVEIDMPART